MDIEVERLINARNGTLVSLSDDMILAIGKRYFELASGKEPVVVPTKMPRSCGTCKYVHRKMAAEPCDSCDIHLGLSNWEPKMDKKKVVQIITDELNHCKIHLNDKDMAPEYYVEMNDLCMAYEFVLDILEKEAKDA